MTYLYGCVYIVRIHPTAPIYCVHRTPPTASDCPLDYEKGLLTAAGDRAFASAAIALKGSLLGEIAVAPVATWHCDPHMACAHGCCASSSFLSVLPRDLAFMFICFPTSKFLPNLSYYTHIQKALSRNVARSVAVLQLQCSFLTKNHYGRPAVSFTLVSFSPPGLTSR